jgi:hypothetical protein
VILRPLEGRTGTGPIDNLAMYETQLECPECGAFEVWHIPEQQGTCHGGQFTNSCIEYHWCESCEACLTDKEQDHE